VENLYKIVNIFRASELMFSHMYVSIANVFSAAFYMYMYHSVCVSVMLFCVVVKTLVIQNEKSQLQSELDRVNKELAVQCGKAVSYFAVNCCSRVLFSYGLFSVFCQCRAPSAVYINCM